jgi:hypothetical protein
MGGSSTGGTVGSIAGGLLGTAVAPGIGTVVGSELGGMVGGEAQNVIGGIGTYEAGVGGNIIDPAMAQYTAGATGQLTPAQAAMASQALREANLSTTGAYSNLGLGNSTMMGQDVAENQIQNLAEQSNLEAQSEQLGLAGLNAGLNYEQGAAGNFQNISSDQLNLEKMLASAYGGQSAGGGTGSPLGGGSSFGGLGTGVGATGGLPASIAPLGGTSLLGGTDATLATTGTAAIPSSVGDLSAYF